MNYDEFENRTFDNHAALNRYQNLYGMKPSEKAIRPSLYISDLKMKKAFKTLSDEEIKTLYRKPNAQLLGIRLLRENLEDRLKPLMDWQTFLALIHLLRDGNYACAEFVLKCRPIDVCPYENEDELYLIIQSL